MGKPHGNPARDSWRLLIGIPVANPHDDHDNDNDDGSTRSDVDSDEIGTTIMQVVLAIHLA